MRFAAFAILAVVVVAPAFARADDAPPRQVVFAQVLKDIDGNPIQECADPNQTVPVADPACKRVTNFTLGLVASRSLVAPEQGITAEEMVKRWQLAQVLLKATTYALTEEEVVLIKKQIARVYASPTIVGQTLPMLFSK
jgi:hypothetical protein